MINKNKMILKKSLILVPITATLLSFYQNCGRGGFEVLDSALDSASLAEIKNVFVAITDDSTPEELCSAASEGTLPQNAIDITHPPGASGIVPADSTGTMDAYESFLSAGNYFSNKNDGVRRVLIFPKGIYKIDHFIDLDNEFTQNIGKSYLQKTIFPRIVFKNSSYFRIIGCNAKILVKGDFSKAHGLNASVPIDKAGVIPFTFENSSHFGLYGVDQDGTDNGYGLELNGNVNQMSRDKSLGEDPGISGGHGIATAGCYNYEFSNLNVHHFSTDGILIGIGLARTIKKEGLNYSNLDKNDTTVITDILKNIMTAGDGKYGFRISDKFAKINHVISSNNARQGISVIHALDLTVSNSIFTKTGRTGLGLDVNSSMPGFAPQAGVDIEPNFTTNPYCQTQPFCGSFPLGGKKGEIYDIDGKSYTLPADDTADYRLYYVTDFNTSNIVFNNCEFTENVGSQIAASVTHRASDIHFNNPKVVATYNPQNVTSITRPNSNLIVINLNVDGGYIDSGTIQTGLGHIFASSSSEAKSYINGVEIRTQGYGLMSISSGNKNAEGVLQFTNSRIIVENTTPTLITTNYPSLAYINVPFIRNSNSNSKFALNNIFYPKEVMPTSEWVSLKNITMPASISVGLINIMCNSNFYQVYGNTFSTDYKGPIRMQVDYLGSQVSAEGNTMLGDYYPNYQYLSPLNGTLNSEHIFNQNCVLNN